MLKNKKYIKDACTKGENADRIKERIVEGVCIMQLFIVILKKADVMDELIRQLARAGVKGATILTGTGMAEALVNMEDLPLFGMLRRIMSDKDPEDSKVMLIALDEDMIGKVKEIIKSSVGSFEGPNTGVMFSVPILSFEGIAK